ncbi:MAG: acyltransferase [Chthoniobacteraceae bacterium]
MSNIETNRVLEFEGLRGFLSWWVVLDHLLLACGFNAETLPVGIRLLARGDYAVDVFIILSGFVIFKLLTDAQETYRVFLVRRFFRLYPVFLVCLLVAAALRPLIWSNLSHWTGNRVVLLGQRNWIDDGAHFWPYLATHLILLHGAIPDFLLHKSASALLAPAWSISLEWQFYLIAPLLFWFLRRNGLGGWLVFGVCVFVGSWLLHNQLEAQFFMNAFLPQRIVFFWIGIISFYFWRECRGGGDAPAMFLVGICPLILFFTLSIPLTIWSVIMAVAMLHKGAAGRRAAAVLLAPFMQKLGRVSYSTYLGHICCIWLLQWLIFLVLPGVSPACMLCLLFITSVPVIYFVSCAMHCFIEVPGMRLGRRLSS